MLLNSKITVLLKPAAVLLLFLSMALVLTVLPASGEPDLTIVKNESVGLLRFVLGISGVGDTSKINVLAYTEARNDMKADEIHIDNVKKIFNDLPKTFTLFPDKNIAPSRNYISFVKFLYYYAVVSEDIRRFEFSLYALMPPDYAARLISELEYFRPVYNKIHREPTEKALDDYLKKPQNSDCLKKLGEFYGCDTGCPEVKAVIVPVYVSRELYEKHKKILSARSENFGNLQIVEVLFPGNRFDDPRGTVIHEACHFYYNMSPLIEKTIEGLKKDNSVEHAFCARLLNEALATAIGNGYFEKCDPKTNWYENDKIDKYAKALLPSIKEYLDSSKKIDGKFTEVLLKAFDAAFSDARRDISFLLYDVHIISNAIDTKDIFGGIHNNFYSNGHESFGEINHPKTLEKFKKTGGYTQIFVVKKSEIELLKCYGLESMGELLKAKVEKPLVYFNFDEKQKCNYLVFVCENIAEFKMSLEKISAARILPYGMQK